MHDHNNSDTKNSGHKGMIWMMIPCLLLLGFILLDGGTVSSGYFWPILIGALVVVHIWMMFRGHNRHRSDTTEDKIDGNSETKDEDSKHTHGGCCH
jgi:hypothetical protein